jgi:cell division protein FtsL
MKSRPFLVVWTLAVIAATSAFTVYLALRMRSIELGYELGRAHAHLSRLREVKRVLELELSSHETPERVDLVARSVLGMSEPSSDRILSAGLRPAVGERSGPMPPEDAPPSNLPTNPSATEVAP